MDDLFMLLQNILLYIEQRFLIDVTQKRLARTRRKKSELNY